MWFIGLFLTDSFLLFLLVAVVGFYLFVLGFCLFGWLVDFGFLFQDRVSLCSPGCPGTCFVDQADLEFRDQPASVSQVLGLKACAFN